MFMVRIVYLFVFFMRKSLEGLPWRKPVSQRFLPTQTNSVAAHMERSRSSYEKQQPNKRCPDAVKTPSYAAPRRMFWHLYITITSCHQSGMMILNRYSIPLELFDLWRNGDSCSPIKKGGYINQARWYDVWYMLVVLYSLLRREHTHIADYVRCVTSENQYGDRQLKNLTIP